MFKIYVSYDFFGTACQDVWQAPDKRTKDCMIKSAQDNGFTVEKIEEVM